ncbi:MAG: DUF4340 domain-containing protein [Desulfomonilia bacterium]
MKSKREYLLLAIIIVALVAYLVVKRTDRVHFDLPDLPQVEPARITKVEVTRDSNTLTVTKRDNTWYIGPEDWPADTKMMQDMVKVFELLKISDLVSESKAYIRYELDEENRISVTAYAGDTLVREFDVGKTAPTYRHTFVRLPGDDNVYMAEGDFRRVFDTTPDDLRNKVVMDFPKDEIKRITLSLEGKTITLNQEEAQEEHPSGEGEETKPLVTWKDDQGNDVKTSVVEELLSSISRLMCEEYINGMKVEEMPTPQYTLVFSGQKDYSIMIYEASEGQEHPAVSSESTSVFLMPDYRMEKIQEFIEEVTHAPVQP